MNNEHEISAMECPCRCDCGTWFDQTDGNASVHSNVLICDSCYEKEDLETTIQSLKEEIENWESDIKFNKEEIAKLEKQLNNHH